jgi:type II secretory pathway component GspD/PulD (secretin)
MRATLLRGLAAAVAFLLLSAAARCEPRITMELKDVSVREAVSALFKQAGERCVIDGEVTGKITAISLKDVPLRSALKAVLKGSNSTFEVRDGRYFVKPKPADPPKPTAAPAPAKEDPPAPSPPAAKKKASAPDSPVNRVQYATRQSSVARSAQAATPRRSYVAAPRVPTSAAVRRVPNYSPVRIIGGRSSSYTRRVYTRSALTCGPSG